VEDYRPGGSPRLEMTALVTNNRKVPPPQRFFPGRVLAFDGVNDYATTSVNMSEMAVGAGDFSISFWVYLNSYPSGIGGFTSRYEWVISTSTESSDAGVGITLFIQDDGRLRLLYGNDNQGLVLHRRRNLTPLAQNQWHHVVAQRAGGQSYIYLNGVNDNGVADVGPASTQILVADKLQLANGNGIYNYNGMNGYLDEVILQTKSISSAEIQARYNSGKGAAPIDLGNLVAYYQMNDASQPSTIVDKGPLGYDLAMQGLTTGEQPKIPITSYQDPI
jgi:hypothetical protein